MTYSEHELEFTFAKNQGLSTGRTDDVFTFAKKFLLLIPDVTHVTLSRNRSVCILENVIAYKLISGMI